MVHAASRGGQPRGAAPRVAAIVLAAGASSRMGTPKALLDFDGRACLDLVLDACRGAGVSSIVLVTSPAGDAIRARAGAVISATNEHPERGMLSSLQAGLGCLPSCDAFLIFPVDYPLVPAGEIRRLIAAFAGHGARIFVPSCQRRRGHPVLVDAALAPEYLALGEDGTARAVMVAHERELAYLETADDRVLMDMDTPADYQRCLARFRAGQIELGKK
jgi:molybdenum cofactor cytidylyltransferase